MFASRTNWHRQPNELSRLVTERRHSSRSFIDLTRSNPTECGFIYPAESILKSLASPASLAYHPDPHGMLAAREAVAGYYRSKSLEVDPRNILLTASTSEAYAMVFRLLCDVGDEVLIPVPSYPLFEFLAQLNDVTLRPYHLHYDGEWHVESSSVVSAMSSCTKAIIIINPHNPTGMFLKQSELTAFSDLAAERGLALIVDEVFIDYGYDRVHAVHTAAHDKALTFTMNGISKFAALPQMKLGWIAVSGPVAKRIEALARLEIVADTYLSVNTPVQVALPELLMSSGIVREAIRNRARENYGFLRNAIGNNSVCSVLQSEGGWHGIVQVPQTRTGEEWAVELLKQRDVYLHPGYFFEFERDNVLVFSLLTPPDEFHEGVRRVCEFVEKGEAG